MSDAFVMDAGLAAVPPEPVASPAFRPPPGAVDAHCHVFGPGDQFPLRAGAQVHAVRRAARSSCSRCATSSASTRNVIVQATCHGADNRALVDALHASDGRARGRRHGQARASPTTSWQALHDAGVRGVRFNFVKRLVDSTPDDVLQRDRRPDRAAGLARRGLFRGAGPAPSCCDFFTVPADRRSSSTTWAGPT